MPNLHNQCCSEGCHYAVRMACLLAPPPRCPDCSRTVACGIVSGTVDMQRGALRNSPITLCVPSRDAVSTRAPASTSASEHTLRATPGAGKPTIFLKFCTYSRSTAVCRDTSAHCLAPANSKHHVHSAHAFKAPPVAWCGGRWSSFAAHSSSCPYQPALMNAFLPGACC